jgi:hypothetical protein
MSFNIHLSESRTANVEPNDDGSERNNRALQRLHRKKVEEQARRDDLNNAFAMLRNAVVDVNPVVAAQVESRNRGAAGYRRLMPGGESMTISRVALLNESTALIKDLHRQNEQRKMIITHLQADAEHSA